MSEDRKPESQRSAADTAQSQPVPNDALASDSAPDSASEPNARPQIISDDVAQSQAAPDSQTDNAGVPDDFEPLTATYERLRHSTNPAELSEFARRSLPDKSDQAAFSRATALLEAVAGNPHTPVEDRIFLAETMPFPNVLVKLSIDEDANVRKAVAANADDKNWLVGRLTKDTVPEVRDTALRNKRTSWKMRLEGAQNPELDADMLDFLSRFGVESEPNAPAVLTSMVRRAVALNPNTSADTLTRLASDPDPVVAKAAASVLSRK